MREIKFRAWDKSSSEMMSHEEFCPDDNVTDYDGWVDLDSWLRSDDYVIMQYTGLKDKNGKEIYEGDIFKKGRVKFTIEFRDGAFEMIGINIISVIRLSHSYRDIEIVGNIYENPELLDKE